jgi:hypothetical protein
MPPTESERVTAAIVPVDAAARACEERWGVGRVEGLVSAATLLAWREGWGRYAEAVRLGLAADVERLAPKIIAAIGWMQQEAEARGWQPLDCDAWEAPLADGRVLVVVKTPAAAHATGRLPDARERVVWSLDELACVLPQLEAIQAAKLAWPGARVQPMTRRGESWAHDWATGDMPELHEPA